jgi:peroxiredoxin
MILIGLGLIVVGVAAFFLLPQATDQTDEFSATPIKVSFAAPELALTDLDGSPVSLAEWRGSVVLVNNWATWCPPCKAEMPTLQAYYQKHQKDGFTVIAIESGEPAAEVAQFVSEYGLTFPVWPDENELAIETFKNWELPSSYVIDRTGTVRLTWIGAISQKTLEKYVTPLLKE